ncbi:tripartite tricarboxylate transporter permease [Salinicola lusitanus]|uniref:tripartite tricarboxylate transporter permease n=1 Tax=Salinicola lusitanus TaxID=1949085 RepID=UPI000DA1AC44|nr:tripartite tricarboxylate transporter permease [Salinicola lusitanus]
MTAELLSSFGTMLSPGVLALLVLGTVLGVVFGAIPGLNGGMLVALSLPLTFGWHPLTAIALLIGQYVGSIAGGLISATLLNIPGSPSNMMTTLDAMPMARRGQAVRALQLGIVASFFGGLVSWLALVFLSPPLATFALRFGPPEYFALVLSAMALIATLSAGSLTRGLLAGALGMIAALPGLDQVTAQTRLTFGFGQMAGGFELLAVLIGIFAVSQLISDARPQRTAEIITLAKGSRSIRISDFLRQKWNLLRSSLIGTWVGILPGVGGSVGSIMAYASARSMSRTPEQFGKGSEEGVLASESANNATIGGAIIPMITMGIPGSIIDVILIAALTVHDIRPGPLLFQSNPEVVYGFMSSLLLANIVMVVFMLVALRWLARLMTVPKSVLVPTLLVCCILGTYAVNNRLFDVWVMLAFGLVGLAFRGLKLPIAPFVIGFILTPIAEVNLRSALIANEGDWTIFFTRPIAGVFMVLAILFLLAPLAGYLRKRLGSRSAAPT